MGSLLIAAGAACGGGSGNTDAPPGGGGDAIPRADGAAPGPALDELMANPAAGVTVKTRQDGTTGEIYATTITAGFRASPVPSPYAEAQRAGDCVRVVSEVPFCDPPCGGDSVCIAADTCTPIAPLQSAGTLAVGEQELEPNAGVYTFDTVGDIFPATGTLTVSAPGDTFGAFTAELAVPDPITAATLPGSLRAGEDATFTWTPAADAGASVGVILIADRGHNPVHPSVIYCATDDGAGTLTVPSALIDAHVDQANWSCGDCFPSHLVRFRATTTTGGVRVFFGQDVDVFALPDRG